ncbi:MULTISPECIES: signal peptidase I [Bacillus]|uniref:signal peptidase I n=1 Tax=Bacillus TaxID=1386 RepID=UPI000BB754E2|nr:MULTISPECIES: signal peptidase I [Bacillus]
MFKKIFKEIKEWGKAIVIAILLSFVLTAFVAQPFTVSGSSMLPTIEGLDKYDKEKIGDRLLIFKSPYLLGKEPNYGDVVVIDSDLTKDRGLKDAIGDNPFLRTFQNEREDQYWVKRVIGKEGDTISFFEGKVFRNGEELEEEYLNEEMFFPFESVKIPENHVFVMGDNRNDSRDSRHIGAVPTDHVVGKVVFRFYPFDKFTSF